MDLWAWTFGKFCEKKADSLDLEHMQVAKARHLCRTIIRSTVFLNSNLGLNMLNHMSNQDTYDDMMMTALSSGTLLTF